MVTQALLVPMQVATLVKLLKGGNNRKAIKVTLLFLLSNLLVIVMSIAFWKVYNSGGDGAEKT